jgi:hypothetical protein
MPWLLRWLRRLLKPRPLLIEQLRTVCAISSATLKNEKTVARVDRIDYFIGWIYRVNRLWR